MVIDAAVVFETKTGNLRLINEQGVNSQSTLIPEFDVAIYYN